MRNIILILVLVVGLFGSVSEEIGVPYVEQEQGRTKGSVLDPNGKYFYTLNKQIISKWQLRPFKKNYSFKVEIEPVTFRNLGYQISITSDSQKMILRSMNNLVLLDLQNKKIIENIKEQTSWGVMDGLIYKTLSLFGKINKQGIHAPIKYERMEY